MRTNSDIVNLRISRGNVCRILTALVNEMFSESLGESSRAMWRDIHDDVREQLDEFDESDGKSDDSFDLKKTELLAHTAWILSDIDDKVALECATEILTKVDSDVRDEVDVLVGYQSRISDRLYNAERRTEMLGEITQGIAEQIRMNQDTKEMTRRAIKLLESLGENADDLRAEFQATYGEKV